jgi:hypothetical protein
LPSITASGASAASSNSLPASPCFLVNRRLNSSDAIYLNAALSHSLRHELADKGNVEWTRFEAARRARFMVAPRYALAYPLAAA